MTVSKNSQTSISEAKNIYQAIYNEDIPEFVEEKFEEASLRILANYRQDEKLLYEKIIQNVSDLDAIETAARYTNTMKLLTTKFQLMVYLAETVPENHKFFVNEQDIGFSKTALILFIGAVKTLIKFLRGFYMLRRMMHA